jgi:hypothetical protein
VSDEKVKEQGPGRIWISAPMIGQHSQRGGGQFNLTEESILPGPAIEYVRADLAQPPVQPAGAADLISREEAINASRLGCACPWRERDEHFAGCMINAYCTLIAERLHSLPSAPVGVTIADAIREVTTLRDNAAALVDHADTAPSPADAEQQARDIVANWLTIGKGARNAVAIESVALKSDLELLESWITYRRGQESVSAEHSMTTPEPAPAAKQRAREIMYGDFPVHAGSVSLDHRAVQERIDLIAAELSAKDAEIERQREEITYAAALANKHATESQDYMNRWLQAKRELATARADAIRECQNKNNGQCHLETDL